MSVTVAQRNHTTVPAQIDLVRTVSIPTHRFTQVEALHRLHNFTRSYGPQNLILIYDLDLALLQKPRKYFSGAQISPPDFTNLRDIFYIARGSACTGRGYNQVRHFRNSVERAPHPVKKDFPAEIIIASNTGAQIDYPEGIRQREILWPEGQDKKTFLRAAEISRRVTREIIPFIESRHPGLNGAVSRSLVLENREFTGAVVITEQDGMTWELLDHEIRAKVTAIDGDGLNLVNCKGRTVAVPQNDQTMDYDDQIMGYVDITPKGVTKGPAAARILDHIIGDQPSENYFVITAGDNAADIPMMDAIKKRMGANNMLGICVGDNTDLGECSAVNMAISGHKKIDAIHKGKPFKKDLYSQNIAVRNHHDFITGIRAVLVDDVMPPHDGRDVTHIHSRIARLAARAR